MNARGLAAISGERIWQELTKLLAHRSPGAQLVAMSSTGVAEEIGLPVTARGLAAAETACAACAKPAVIAGMLFAGLPDTSLDDAARRWRVSSEEAALMRAAATMEPDRDRPF